MSRKQFYGIKYPFVSRNSENYFVDLNYDIKSKIKSLIMHVVFTPKGQKIRDPEFGTDFVKFLYDQNDVDLWYDIKGEIGEIISRYVPGITINEISVLENDDNDNEGSVYVRFDYTIDNGIKMETDSLITKV